MQLKCFMPESWKSTFRTVKIFWWQLTRNLLLLILRVQKVFSIACKILERTVRQSWCRHKRIPETADNWHAHVRTLPEFGKAATQASEMLPRNANNETWPPFSRNAGRVSNTSGQILKSSTLVSPKFNASSKDTSNLTLNFAQIVLATASTTNVRLKPN